MRNHRRTPALFMAIAFLLPLVAAPHVWGWGNEGHQTVGAIADQLIAGKKAQVEVKALLEPDETLSAAAIWADCAKGYCGPLTQEMHDFVSRNPRHHSYHYTDVPYQESAYKQGAVGTDPDDVVQTLQRAIAVLRGDPSVVSNTAVNPHHFTKREALRLLVHLVGDIHQPLHVGAAYINEDDVIAIPRTAAEAKSWFTEGDNFLKVGNKNFHSYWDSDTVKLSQRRAHALDAPSYAAYLIKRFPSVPASPGSVDAWAAVWATEALARAKLAHQRISPGAREEVADHHGGRHDEWPVTLPPGYPTRAANIAAEQIAHGGRRLAAVLMAIWP